MPIDSRAVVRVLSEFAADRNVRQTVKLSATGAAVCAATTFVGGVLLGPVGLALGGSAGGLLAYKMTNGEFLPLSKVLMTVMTDDQRERLVQNLIKALRDVQLSDIGALVALMSTSTAQIVWSTVNMFMRKEMGLELVD